MASGGTLGIPLQVNGPLNPRVPPVSLVTYPVLPLSLSYWSLLFLILPFHCSDAFCLCFSCGLGLGELLVLAVVWGHSSFGHLLSVLFFPRSGIFCLSFSSPELSFGTLVWGHSLFRHLLSVLFFTFALLCGLGMGVFLFLASSSLPSSSLELSLVALVWGHSSFWHLLYVLFFPLAILLRAWHGVIPISGIFLCLCVSPLGLPYFYWGF